MSAKVRIYDHQDDCPLSYISEAGAFTLSKREDALLYIKVDKCGEHNDKFLCVCLTVGNLKTIPIEQMVYPVDLEITAIRKKAVL